MNVLSLFDGISCSQLALARAGSDYAKCYASEIDPKAVAVTQKNFPDTVQLGSVENLNLAALPQIDLLLGGSPCQGFSFSGKRLNFSDPRSALYFHFSRILKTVKPKFFLLENVRMKKEYADVISNDLGVEPIRINSSLVSAQNRQRFYWSSIPGVTQPVDKGIHLKSIVGDYDGIDVYPRGNNKGGLQGYKGKAPTITTSQWQGNFFVAKDGNKRRFTIEEAEQLQTIPVGYTDCPECSNNVRFKLVGNAWTVDVVAHILGFMEDKDGRAARESIVEQPPESA